VRPVVRARTIACDVERVWSLVSQPDHLPRWWPALARVEEATPTAWTKVLQTSGGRPVRADFTRVAYEYERRLAWRQELEQSPFERVFASAVTEIVLEPQGPDATHVELRALEELRGRFKLGGFMVRRAARRRLDEALAGLERALVG
jgi:uncharacterized protein YndB with AHSA1/START domain